MSDGTIDLMLPTEDDGYQPILTASIGTGFVVLCTIDGGNRIEHSISAKVFQVWASTVLAEISLVEVPITNLDDGPLEQVTFMEAPVDTTDW